MKTATPRRASLSKANTRGQPADGALLVLVFLSGFAALVYELLWFRQLGHIFGNTVQAAATVLAAFMLGLAWGADLARRRVAHLSNPVRWFGLLEAGIGLYALAVPAAFALASLGYRAAAFHIPTAPLLIAGLRFVLATLVLLVPTLLMGASLPVLSEVALRSRDRFASRLGWLYGSNTAGATLGVLACGFVLVPHWGVHATNTLAAAVNLAAGLAAVLMSRHAVPAARTATTQTAQPAITPRPVGLLAVAAVCGFLALGFETVWFRALVLVFGSTSHSFAIMVAGFLLGLTIGAAAFGRLADHPRRAAWALAAALSGIGLWTLGSMRLYDSGPEFLLRWLTRFDFSWRAMLLAKAILASVFLLPLAVLSGLAFPAVVRLVRDRSASAGRAVGAVFSVNALGSAAGAAVTGFALLPFCGLEHSLLVLGGVALLLGIAVAWRASGAAWPSRLGFAVIVTIAAAGLYRHTPSWDPLLLSSGAYFSPTTHVENGRVVLRDRLRSVELLFYREGATATLAVTRTPDGRLFFSSDGKVEADTSPPDMVLQRMQGHLPMLLHPDPRQVLNIGLGAGVTSGAISIYPNVHLDVVDIEPVVTNVAALWAPWNHDLIRRGRFNFLINDGRNHLLVTTNRYDVITSDPFEPVVAGAANLYTVEHFRLARARLAAGGLMAQFLPLYELSRADLLMILRSFLRVFPRSAVFFTGKDTILLGMTDGASIALETAAAKLVVPEVRASLAEIGVDRPERLLDMLVMSFDPGHSGALENGPVNTDDLPIIEFSAPKSALVYQPDANQQVLLNSFHDIPAAYLAGLTQEAIAAATNGHKGLRLLLQAGILRSAGDLRGSLEMLNEAARLAPASPIIRNELAQTLAQLAWEAQLSGKPREALEWNQAILKVSPRDFWALHNLALMALADKQTALAQDYLKRGLEVYPDAALLLALRGRYLGSTGDIAAACRDLKAAARILPRRSDYWDYYAYYLERNGQPAEASIAAARARQARTW
jgi:spermidine synthase